MDKYIELLLRDQPEYILGLGIYTGRDRNKIHLEAVCFSPKGVLAIPNFLVPGNLSQISESIGRHYCNLISWKIVQLIHNGDLRSKYTFLHLPKNMTLAITVPEINSMVQNHFVKEPG